MKEYIAIAALIIGFMAITIASVFIGMEIAFNRMDKNSQIVPIIVHCPDNTKQIVIPNANKMEL